jgi:hypothetical protein
MGLTVERTASAGFGWHAIDVRSEESPPEITGLMAGRSQPSP